ncbi:hypothetical protein MAPG_09370, partial [Magnaporthiopsis poae ATCC 64411]
MVKTTQILFAVAAAIIAVPIDASSAVSRSLERRHVSLAEPRPYKGTGYGPTNPLDTDGGNYPCKAPGGDGSKLVIDGSPTTVVIGEPQTVSFDGHAVHGGGSCQFGLTEGFAPTKNSVFKVIQSIEGGCPKANQPGNLEAGQKADTFSFTVPADFAPGDYTFGWIWINRIGGAPEIYMNCAPITVKAGKGSTRRSKDRREMAAMSKRQTSKYPDFFLANLGSMTGGCDTNDALRQQVPISYPNPGTNVLRPEGTSKLLAQKCDGNPHNKGAAPAKPSGTATATATASSGAGPTSTATPTTQSSAATTAAPTSTSTLRNSELGYHDCDLDLCHYFFCYYFPNHSRDLELGYHDCGLDLCTCFCYYDANSCLLELCYDHAPNICRFLVFLVGECALELGPHEADHSQHQHRYPEADDQP